MPDNTLDPSVSGSEAMRATFEAWCRDELGYGADDLVWHDVSFGPHFDKGARHRFYASEVTDALWGCWQAARADQARIVNEAVDWADAHGEAVFYGGGWLAVNAMNEWTQKLRARITPPAGEEKAHG